MRRTRPRARPLGAHGPVAGAILVLLVSGCATSPPRLPPAGPGDLPDAWLAPLSQPDCPGPLEARLRLRIKVEGHPGFQADGTLKAILPDTLRLNARLGVFRPLFGLIAEADSCELLDHEAAAYWIVPRDGVDWKRMDPAAWARALHWALCPADLIGSFQADGPGRMDGALWSVEGGLEGSPYRIRLAIDPGRRSVRRIEVLLDDLLLAGARLDRYRFWEGSWVPSRIGLQVPGEGLSLLVDVTGWDRLQTPPRDGMIRPPGWDRVGRGLSLPVRPAPAP